MPVIEAELKPVPWITPVELPDISDLSDDECLIRLAAVVASHDPEDLDEVAHLIARLAVTIE